MGGSGRWASRRGAAVVAGLVVVLSGAGVEAQNLLTNPNFKSSLSSWDPSPAGAWSHDPNQGSPSPGSALGNNTLDHVYNCISLFQCRPATPGHIYRFGASCRELPGQANVGTCYAELHWTPGDHCAGQTAMAYSEGVMAPGSWAGFGSSGVAPAGSGSQYLILSLCKYEAGGSLKANFDSAYVYDQGRPPGRGDFDSDGHTDLVLHDNMTGENRLWLMNGVKRLSSQLVSPQAVGRLIRASADFDGDAHSDLVLRDNVTGAIEFWFMDGATRVGPAVPLTGAATPPIEWSLAASADFNHDGHPDLAWRNSTTQKLMVWTMSGTAKTGELTPNPDQAADANWSVAAALDFDKDGNTDLLWYNGTSGKVVLWRLDANLVRTAGEFTSPDSAGNTNWRVVAGGDYSGKQTWLHTSNDIVWRNASSGKFVVWHMDPQSTPLTRTLGEFTDPSAPTANPTDWTIVGPK